MLLLLLLLHPDYLGLVPSASVMNMNVAHLAQGSSICTLFSKVISMDLQTSGLKLITIQTSTLTLNLSLRPHLLH